MSTELVAIIPKKQKYANIVWQVSNLCNYRCGYCNEGNWKGNHLNLNKEKIIAGLEKIYYYYLSCDYKLLKLFFSTFLEKYEATKISIHDKEDPR